MVEVGVDLGYGFVKATDGREGFMFPSVVGAGTSVGVLRLKDVLADPTDDMRVSVDGQLYYVGNYAIRRSPRAFRGMSVKRGEGNALKVLFLAALSQFAREPVTSFSVVTGLPPGRMGQSEELVRALKGEHRMVRHSADENPALSLKVEDVAVVPQPVGAYWAEVLDGDGQVRQDSPLLRGRVGVVDIGYKTSDLVVMEDTEYVPERSTTVPVGVSSAYAEIAEKLAAKYGVEKETYALDGAVITGKMVVAGQVADISEVREPAFAGLATKVVAEVLSTWQMSEFASLLLVGGGAVALGKYLLPHLPVATVVDDPVTANSRGFWAWAHRLGARAATGAGSVAAGAATGRRSSDAA